MTTDNEIESLGKLVEVFESFSPLEAERAIDYLKDRYVERPFYIKFICPNCDRSNRIFARHLQKQPLRCEKCDTILLSMETVKGKG